MDLKSNLGKAVVLGHTNGIGKGIHDALGTIGYEVVGLSRSNGYNLMTDMDRILAVAEPADLFVNNAFVEFMNVRLLLLLSEHWKNTDKTIINISSEAADNATRVSPYAVAKLALDRAAEQIQNTPNSCRVIQIRPGYVDTPRVQKIEQPKLHTDDITRTILWCLQQPKHVYIRNISMRIRQL